MCGIAGIFKSASKFCSDKILNLMRDSVRHRGPDDLGIQRFMRLNNDYIMTFESEINWQVALLHRRLSILDLSPAGHQPMQYADSLWIAYNGEVYNYVELRAELEQFGHVFKSTSDTEVILASYAEWGPNCFERLRGMWGLILFDMRRNEIILCRDRLGIKPLYVWKSDGLVAVASEIKQFICLPNFKPQLNPVAAAEYLYTGYEDQSCSFFKDVQPILPGTWQKLSLDTLTLSTPQPYWWPENIQESIDDEREAAKRFTDCLRESVQLHLRSDVPVGCALSGGLDSSSIAILVNEIQDSHDEPFHTFTSTFPGERIDERNYVDVVTQAIKSQPHFVTPDPVQFLNDWPRFVWMHDEPVGSLSVYASYCIARRTSELGVPVSLNGQGGDEILSGYWQTYFMYLRSLAMQADLSGFAGHLLGSIFGGNPNILVQIPIMLRRYRSRSQPGTSFRLRSPLNEPVKNLLDHIISLDTKSRRVYEIRHQFLPRLLKYDDRNSMAFSVEGRYPFLDHELIELCLSFKPRVLYRRGWTKWPLRKGLVNILPKEVLFRKTKFGFETPQDRWICGPLRKTLEYWLEQDRPAWKYIDHKTVLGLADHTWQLQGKNEESGQALFRIFAFDHWLETFSITS
jgi:asparagine synthase (glutamine-hydrolysing)